MEAIDIPATNRDKSHVNLITKKSRLDELRACRYDEEKEKQRCQVYFNFSFNCCVFLLPSSSTAVHVDIFFKFRRLVDKSLIER